MVTGDDFIARLHTYLRNVTQHKQDKPVTVRLNQQCLCYLAEKLRDLDQQRRAGLEPLVRPPCCCAAEALPQIARTEGLQEAFPRTLITLRARGALRTRPGAAARAST